MPGFDQFLVAVTFACAIGSGLIAGVFFGFSTFVMQALRRLPGEDGMPAMQSINVVVINPIFLGVFLGTAVSCLLAGIGAVMRWDRPFGIYLLVGALLYLVGTFLVTILGNVPLNDALAKVTTSEPDAAQKWSSYVSRWTMWNHVRTVAALGAMICFILAIRR